MSLVHCLKRAKMSSTHLKQNLGLVRLYSASHLDSRKLMKLLARTGIKGEPMAMEQDLIRKRTSEIEMCM